MKKIVFSVIAAPLVLLTCLTSVAQATAFNWSYTWNSGAVLSGMLEGTIQAADPNKIDVSSIMGSYTGPNAADFDLDPTFTLFSGSFAVDPFVTFDGSEFALISNRSPFSDFEFLLHTGFNTAKLYNPPSLDGSATPIEDEGVDPILNDFVASEHWSISEKTPVPAPATIVLFGLGVAGLGWSRRKA